jgi:hypothetical protein
VPAVPVPAPLLESDPVGVGLAVLESVDDGVGEGDVDVPVGVGDKLGDTDDVGVGETDAVDETVGVGEVALPVGVGDELGLLVGPVGDGVIALVGAAQVGVGVGVPG